MRTILHCNDNWTFRKPGEAATKVTLPHTWNAVDGQDSGNDYWRGTAPGAASNTLPLTARRVS